jgi:MscS family membrane protein
MSSYFVFLERLYLGTSVKNYLISFFIIVVFGILKKVAKFLFDKYAISLARKTETKLDDILCKRVTQPFSNYIFIAGFYFAKNYINFPIDILLNIKKLILVLFILNSGYLIFKISNVIIDFLKPIVLKTKIKLDDSIFLFLNLSVKIFIFLFTLIITIDTAFGIPKNVNEIFSKLIITLVTIVIIYIFFTVSDNLVNLLKPYIEKTSSKLDDQILPILRKIIKFLILGTGFLTILKNCGYDVSTLIAGLGIGGLAFALAAKDTLANLFGSVVIFLDCPFKIGDRVVFNSKDGVVEEVGMRSTRLRTLEGTLITVPNSEVANASIENISLRPKRKVSIKVGLVYETTSEKLNEAIEIVKYILDNNAKVAVDKYIYFSDFGDFSLNITVIYWINELDYSKFIDIQNDINFCIKKEFQKTGIDFAFPSQTLYLKKEE